MFQALLLWWSKILVKTQEFGLQFRGGVASFAKGEFFYTYIYAHIHYH